MDAGIGSGRPISGCSKRKTGSEQRRRGLIACANPRAAIVKYRKHVITLRAYQVLSSSLIFCIFSLAYR